jgi:phosphoglycerate dehydrogenase-like enzyme
VTCSPDSLVTHLDGVDILVPPLARIDRDVIERGHFGLIHQFGVGLDNVDVPAATQAGVWVARLPAFGTGNADSVAEHALLLMLALSRRLPQAHQTLQEGRLGQPPGTALFGKTACLVGPGDIGMAVAQRLHALGMRLVAVRRNPQREIVPGLSFQHIYAAEELHRALRDAEYVIVCVNYDAHSHHLINHTALAAMKEGAYLINVARGGLVDPEALFAVLQSGYLAGAGLDVFWEEPVDPKHPLFEYNVIGTPHIAGVTDAFYSGGAQAFAHNVERYARGKPLQHVVNEPINPRHPLG